MATLPATHVTVSIERPPAEVYAFAADPANLPRWAAGLGGTVTRAGDAWIAEGPLGRVTLRFAPRNALGVLDHDVVLASGERFHNPMRVLPNAEGSEVVFTLFRRPGTSEEAAAADAEAVLRDLRTLKRLLEVPAAAGGP